jgi:hypothetical protein
MIIKFKIDISVKAFFPIIIGTRTNWNPKSKISLFQNCTSYIVNRKLFLTMKKYSILLALFLFGAIRVHATDDSDSLGLPGDNLDLAGVLDIFKTSTSLDDFEKKLNDPANDVNNLDLNNDQNVDYIRVVDEVSGDAHDIVLQVPVSADESQDVAVIEVEKNGTESAQLQISGDEELYGENYFIEPNDQAVATPTEQKWQGFRPVTVFVNVWMWTPIRFIYAPAYVVYVSPYRWMYYPNYWHPWHPVMWRIHHEHVMRYHEHCVCVHECRMATAHAYYHNHRMASPAVHRAYAADHQRHEARESARAGNSGNGNQKVNPPRENGSAQATGKSAGPGGKKGNGGQKAGKGAGQKKAGGGGGGRAGAGGGQKKAGGGGGGGRAGGGGGKHR